jgi:hypothetical protein
MTNMICDKQSCGMIKYSGNGSGYGNGYGNGYGSGSGNGSSGSISSISSGYYDYNQFEMFYMTVIMLMPISKKYSQFIKIDVLRRKINQYTNWNILMMLMNSVLYNIFNIDNHIISRFIAINSIQIMTLFHMFMIYDSNVLFCVMDAKPFLLKNAIFNRISNNLLVRFEYFLANIVVHIMPVYYYRDYFTIKDNSNLDMFHYIIMFKFMWVLNIFGDFNITSIYVPTFNGCNVKLINLVVIVDFVTYKLINYMLDVF